MQWILPTFLNRGSQLPRSEDIPWAVHSVDAQGSRKLVADIATDRLENPPPYFSQESTISFCQSYPPTLAEQAPRPWPILCQGEDDYLAACLLLVLALFSHFDWGCFGPRVAGICRRPLMR